jgi:hypothetical protein
MIKELKSVMLDFAKFTATIVALALIIIFTFRIMGIPVNA